MKLSWNIVLLILIVSGVPLGADTITLESGDKLQNVRSRTEGNTIIIFGKEQEIIRVKASRIKRRSLGPKKRPNFALRAIVWPGWGEYKRNPDNLLAKKLMGGFGALALVGVYAAREHFAAQRIYKDNSFQNMLNFGSFAFLPANNPAGLAMTIEFGKNHYQPIKSRRNHYATLGNTAGIMMAVLYGWNIFRLGLFSRRKVRVRNDTFQRLYFGLGQNQNKQNYITVGVKF